MKFKAKVAVVRDGRTKYYATADVARRMVLEGLAVRRGQVAIELPGEGSAEELNVSALLTFADGKPEWRCYGSHTSPSIDRLSYAPCFYRAHTGKAGGTAILWKKPHVEDQAFGDFPS